MVDGRRGWKMLKEGNLEARRTSVEGSGKIDVTCWFRLTLKYKDNDRIRSSMFCSLNINDAQGRSKGKLHNITCQSKSQYP